ncbi:MAG: hypothetical protein ACI8PG_003584 [Planctomycetota bacterium]|jgi:hypothetical protein
MLMRRAAIARMLAAVKEGIPLALAADERGGWGRDGSWGFFGIPILKCDSEHGRIY